MAIYAIGDIQGCYDEFMALLDKVSFDPKKDTLWLTGDLVNRGPNSLEVLRFVKDQGDSAITVLGNHDLHLLAVWKEKNRNFKSNNTLKPILKADDCEEIMEWLRQRPLLHHDAKLGCTMIHAGLPPQWDLEKARACAAEVEEVLRGPLYIEFLENMYGNKPARWADDLEGWDRLRFSVNCFTRLRFCTPKGKLEFDHKGTPGTQADNYVPWFEVRGRESASEHIVFGHWSTLGLHLQKNISSVDTGCLWGGYLTALRLDKNPHRVVQLSCKSRRKAK